MNKMAAVVIYAGSRQGGQLRTGPVGVDVDTKNSVFSYIERAIIMIFVANIQFLFSCIR